MPGKKKPPTKNPEEIKEAEIIEPEITSDSVPDPQQSLVEESGKPSLKELETDPTAINRVGDVKSLSDEELAALARCGLRIEVSNPNDTRAAQRYFMARNAVERVLEKLTGGAINMEKVDQAQNQEALQAQLLAALMQHLQGGAQPQQVQQQVQPAQAEEPSFWDGTAGTCVKYGAAAVGGAALLYGGQRLLGGDSGEVAALALNLADAW